MAKNVPQLIYKLHSLLLSNKKVAYFNSDKSELSCRCPYCGDSEKDLRHAHLYISVNEPFLFFCQRCETKGSVTSKFIRDILDTNDSIGLDFDIISRSHKKNSTLKKAEDTNETLPIIFPKYDLTGTFKSKLNYIKKRFNRDFSKDDLKKFKFINSFEDYLILNGKEKLLDDDKFYNYVKFIDANAVGWVSRDRSHVCFRYLKPLEKTNRRYVNINIDQGNESASKIYTITNSIDLSVDTIDVIMTEGTFDLISVYSNYYSNNTHNKIFVAINGKGFFGFIKYLFRLGFLKINLHIYSDNDIHVEKYKKIINIDYLNSFKISYNEYPNEKDFGVPIDKIKIKTIKVK